MSKEKVSVKVTAKKETEVTTNSNYGEELFSILGLSVKHMPASEYRGREYPSACGFTMFQKTYDEAGNERNMRIFKRIDDPRKLKALATVLWEEADRLMGEI